MKRASAARNRVEVNAKSSGAFAQRLAARAARKLRAFLQKLELRGVELSVALVGDAEIRRLNRTYRHKDKATDVLSFVVDESPGDFSQGGFLGDLVVSLQTTKRAAKARAVPLEEEFDRYLAHGLLHLLGFDHIRRRDAVKMAAAEESLLGRQGMVPPRGRGTIPARERARRPRSDADRQRTRH